MKIRTYSEMIQLKTFEERFEYLKLGGQVGISTFGFDRHLNQAFYKSPQWQSVRNEVIVRDNGCDLAVFDREIYDRILIHHMNPITEDDLLDRNPDIWDPEFLICTTHLTHNAIHYGDASLLVSLPKERFPGDTKLW